jgi:hypothetical protein
MSLSSPRICVSLGCMLLFIGVLGCGSSTLPTVNGTVNYKGMPVTGGLITFHFGGDKIPAYGSIDGSGKYFIQSPITGQVKVTIDTESIRNSNSGAALMAKMGGTKDAMPKLPGGDAVTTSYMKIPAKYAAAEKTDLSYTVKSGPQIKDFELTD